MRLFLLWPRKLFKWSSLEAYGWHYEYFTESSLKIRPIAYTHGAKFHSHLYLGNHNDFPFGFAMQVFVWLIACMYFLSVFLLQPYFPHCSYKEDSYCQCGMIAIWGLLAMSLLPHKYREYDVHRNEEKCSENDAWCSNVFPEAPKLMQNVYTTLTSILLRTPCRKGPWRTHWLQRNATKRKHFMELSWGLEPGAGQKWVKALCTFSSGDEYARVNSPHSDISSFSLIFFFSFGIQTLFHLHDFHL